MWEFYPSKWGKFDNMIGDVEVVLINENIYLKGLPAKVFLKDIVKIYKYDQVSGEVFFRLVISGFLIQRASMRFHRYFSLEVYSMLAKLFNVTKRNFYKEAMNGLIETDNVLKNYISDPIPVPGEVYSRLEKLKGGIKLFPYQTKFLEILYNSVYKLGLRGNICSFGTGMGKTVSVLAAIYAMDASPCIITAPKSTLYSAWYNSILKFLPNVKEKEIQVIHDYDGKSPWKYMICNYERLHEAMQYSTKAMGDVKCLIIDECHNFRYLNTIRSQRVFEMVDSLDIKMVVPVSGTPIKARASELLPMLKLLDPRLTDEVVKYFKRMYGADRYTPLIESVISKRLSIYIDREVLSEGNSSGFPDQVKMDINCKIKNPEKYYIETVKKELKESVDKQIPEYAKKQGPNFEKLKSLMDKLPDSIPIEDRTHYIKLVKIKMNAPMSEDGIRALPKIKEYEKIFKKETKDTGLGKEIVQVRKACTAWLQILIGKELGIYFVKRKIECICQMVKENASEICKVLNEAELKSIVFSNYVDPLNAAISEFKKYDLNGVLVAGGKNTNDLLNQFYNDNTLDFVAGTIGSIGTGTDGLQKYCSTMVIFDFPYRSADLVQTEARIYRRGASSKVVKFYYLKLDTEKPNLVNNSEDIMNWSRQMFDIAMTLDNSKSDKDLSEEVNLIIEKLLIEGDILSE